MSPQETTDDARMADRMIRDTRCFRSCRMVIAVPFVMCLVGTFIITHGGRFVKKKEINLWTIRSLCGIIEMKGGE